MSAIYFAIPTNAGQARITNAVALGIPLKITHMAIGDGNGKSVTPNPAQTSLVQEVRRAPLNTLFQDPLNQAQLVAEQIIPEDAGGWWIREVGLYDDSGTLIAVANTPESYKPLLNSGAGRTQIIRMVLAVSDSSAVELKIDPSVVLATRKYIDDELGRHKQSRNHPDASETEKGFSRHASQEEVNKSESIENDAVVTVEKLWGWAKEAGGKVPYVYTLWKRLLDESGYDLIGRFGMACTIENANQVLLSKTGCNVYAWTGELPKHVDVDADPSSVGFTALDIVSLRDQLAAAGSKTLIAGVPAKDVAVQTTFEYLEKFGGVGDEVTDNAAAFAKAKQALGTKKVCRLRQGKTYYIAGARPDLSGLAIYAEHGASLKVDANPNVKGMTLVNDVPIENTSHDTNLVKHCNVSHDYLVSASAAINHLSTDKQLVKKSFTDADASVGAIASGSRDFYGPFTGVLTDQSVSWGASFATGEQGPYFTGVEDGVLYEAAFRHDGNATYSESSFRSVALITSAERDQLSVLPGTASAKIFKVNSASTTVVDTLTTPNGGAYSLSSDGSIVLGMRLCNGSAEFYINGTLIYKYKYEGVPLKVAFLTSYFESDLTVISMPVKTHTRQPRTSSPTSIALIGDSISYGAWASEPYDKIMSEALSMSGLGEVKSINYGVSGSSSANWISGGTIDITTKDFSGVDYALVMLGTNDVQGGVSVAAFETNIRAIVSYLQSQGVTPVLGVFPVWTTPEISGSGLATQNYAKAGEHRQVVKMVAAELDLPLADVCAYLGTDLSLYGDNIHPTESGQIRVAAAFAEAIIGHKSAGISKLHRLPESYLLPLVNSWAAVPSSQKPSAYLYTSSRIVRLSGPISGGVNGSKICTLPAGIRPKFKASFCVPCASAASAFGFAHINIFDNGAVEVVGASVTPYVVWLDSISFPI